MMMHQLTDITPGLQCADPTRAIVTLTIPTHERLSPQDFAQLYAAQLQPVKSFLARRGCTPQSLDDLAQETFLRAWNARHRFAGKSTHSTWLLAIARNVARETRRRPTTVELLDQAQPGADRHDPTSHHELAELLTHALDQLPQKQGGAVRLVYLQQWPQDRAAEQLQCSQPALRQRLASARTSLRNILRAHSPKPPPGTPRTQCPATKIIPPPAHKTGKMSTKACTTT
jgi:RNA polymerase sigma-70 factor (ECF subfamily)